MAEVSEDKNNAAFAAQVAQDVSSEMNIENPYSIGVDIVEVERMKSILNRTPSFRSRVFSEEEQAYCNKTARPECHYATRFAAKEAVLKALGTGFSEGIGVRDVEVVLNSKGKPHIKLYRRAAEIAREMNVKDIPLSLSYTQKDAVACALVLMDDEEKQEAKKDPLKELQQQFKEVRSMLDDL